MKKAFFSTISLALVFATALSFASCEGDDDATKENTSTTTEATQTNAPQATEKQMEKATDAQTDAPDESEPAEDPATDAIVTEVTVTDAPATTIPETSAPIEDADNDVSTETYTETRVYTIEYNKETGIIDVLEDRKIVCFFGLPPRTSYYGETESDGFIFRYGEDVFALQRLEDLYNPIPSKMVHIASGVADVIAVNYYYDDNASGQALFKMTDGSVCCYISWLGDGEPNDPSHLIPVKVTQ